MPWLADRFTLPLRSESWTLAQMELPSQVSNTLWGHRVAKSAKVCKAASNQSLKRFYHPDLSRAVSCSVPFSKSTTVVIYFQPLGEGHSSCTRKEWRPVDVPGSNGNKPVEITRMWRDNLCSCSFYCMHISDGFRVLFLFNFIDIWCCAFVAPEAVWQPHVAVARHGLFQSLKAKLCPT